MAGSAEGGEGAVLCPRCGHRAVVPPDWRLVVCGGCGQPISRMDEEREFD